MQKTIERHADDVDGECRVRVITQGEVYIVEGAGLNHLGLARDPFAFAAANVLVDNSEHAPAFEVHGLAEFKAEAPLIAAVAGVGSAELVNGDSRVRVGLWRAFPVPAGFVLRVKGSPLYVAFRGMQGVGLGKRRVAKGLVFKARKVNGNGEVKDIKARYIPVSILREARALRAKLDGRIEDLALLLEKIKRHVRLACEAARRGARLVRVRVNSRLIDVWVEEV